jgi:hypothetical protein
MALMTGLLFNVPWTGTALPLLLWDNHTESGSRKKDSSPVSISFDASHEPPRPRAIGPSKHAYFAPDFRLQRIWAAPIVENEDEKRFQ